MGVPGDEVSCQLLEAHKINGTESSISFSGSLLFPLFRSERGDTQGRSLVRPGDGKMREPGKEVAASIISFSY